MSWHPRYLDVLFPIAKIKTDCVAGPFWVIGHKIAAAPRHYLLASGPQRLEARHVSIFD